MRLPAIAACAAHFTARLLHRITIVIAVIAAVVLSIVGPNQAFCTDSHKPPNIVLIVADDLGWADLVCYGADLHETPALDKLASQGVRFVNGYAASPVCTPTRASIQTGRHPARLHMTIWSEAANDQPTNRMLLPPVTLPDLPLQELTLAEVLHAAGYVTAHVGKWHLGVATNYPEAQGFDMNIGGTMWGAPQTFFYPFKGQGMYGKELRYVPGLDRSKPGDYLADSFTDKALEIIDSAGDRPFYLNLCYHEPHTPIEAPQSMVDHFQAKLTGGMHHRNPTYAAMIKVMDQNIGRVLDRLQERGLADNTIVLFTSDNGGFINNFKKEKVTDNFPLRSGKGAVYEGGVRVPLIIRWPGVAVAGADSQTVIDSIDFFPTLIEAVGLTETLPADLLLDGLSFTKVLKDPAAMLDREAIYFHYPHYYETTTPATAIRAGDWKLIKFYENSVYELYNLQDDPREQHNLYKEGDKVADDLNVKLHAWLSSVDAQMPVGNPNPPPPKKAKK